MSKASALLIALLLSQLLLLFALQVPNANASDETEWSILYSFPTYSNESAPYWDKDEFCYPPSLIKTKDGGYAITVFFETTYRCQLIKLDANGNVIWNIGCETYDQMPSIIVMETFDGGLIWTIRNRIIKLDSAGSVEWNNTYNYDLLDDRDCIFSILQTNDGGFAFCGVVFPDYYSYSSDRENYDSWFGKIDSNGSIQFFKKYQLKDNSYMTSLFKTSTGYMVAGDEGFTTGSEKTNNVFLAKLALNGNIEWINSYPDTGAFSTTSLLRMDDGSCLLSGFCNDKDPNDPLYDDSFDTWLWKIDSSGSQLWNRTYGGPKQDIASASLVNSDGEIVLLGSTTSYGFGKPDGWLFKVDSSGNMILSKTFGWQNASAQLFSQCLQSPDGGYMFAVRTNYTCPIPSFALIKTNSEGETSMIPATITVTEPPIVLLDVPYVPQGNTAWCWAASTAMILQYYGESVHVWDIGKSLLTDPTVSMNLGFLESYIQTKYPNKFKIAIESRSELAQEDIRQEIITFLGERWPILLNVDPPGGGRHDVVITGYNSSGFFIHDPSGALFTALGRPEKQFYINEYASWEELEPLIFTSIRLIDPQVFLLIWDCDPSPREATLSSINGNIGTTAIHNLDTSTGVYIDYGEWYIQNGLFWNSMNFHPISLDAYDSLDFNIQIFNTYGTRHFDVNYKIIGADGKLYFNNYITNVKLTSYNSYQTWTNNIKLSDYLIAGQQYTASISLYEDSSTTLIDSITFPPIFYGIQSLLFRIDCPVRLLVVDPDGLKVGYDPTSNSTLNQITHSIYYYGNSTDPELVFIPNPKQGNYTVSFFGLSNGYYNFTCTTTDNNGYANNQRLTNLQISKNEIQTLTVTDNQVIISSPTVSPSPSSSTSTNPTQASSTSNSGQGHSTPTTAASPDPSEIQSIPEFTTAVLLLTLFLIMSSVIISKKTKIDSHDNLSGIN